MKASFQGSQGQLTLFFGNKSPHTLERLICNVPPAPQFRFQMSQFPPALEPKRQVQVSLPISVCSSILHVVEDLLVMSLWPGRYEALHTWAPKTGCPSSGSAAEQVPGHRSAGSPGDLGRAEGCVRQVTLQVACIASFLAAPPVQLGYSVQGQVLNQTLSLPLSVGKFCTPPGAPVPREAFFSRWRAIAGALGGLGCLPGMCNLLATSVPMGAATDHAASGRACNHGGPRCARMEQPLRCAMQLCMVELWQPGAAMIPDNRLLQELALECGADESMMPRHMIT